MSAGSVCRYARCIELKPCPIHPKRKPYEGATRSSTLYATTRWRRERKAFLARHTTCVWIDLGRGYVVGPNVCGKPAKVVDHHPAHNGDPVKFWDQSTWRALCWVHSNINTAHEVAARRRRIDPRWA